MKEITKLTSTEATTVKPKGLNHSPEMPGMKATGMNTATIENVVAATARPISAVPCNAAVTRSTPRSMCRTMFSRTTMASSISTPMARDKPKSVMKLSVKPHNHTAMKEVSTEVGRDRAVIRVDRQEFKNTYTTNTVSTAPKTKASMTLLRLRWAFLPPSSVMAIDVPSGSSACMVLTKARTSSATDTVEASRERTIDMPTLGCPLRWLSDVTSANPS